MAGFWEMGEQHGRCRCEELREQDKLLQPHPPEAIARQRRRCRAWLDGELSWPQLLGEAVNKGPAIPVDAKWHWPRPL